MNRPTSLRWKLGVLVVGVSILAALLATIGSAWRDLNTFWDHTAAEVSAIGAIVADQAGAAVMLGDGRAAQEILASLRADERVRDAVIYTLTGKCFAEFHRAPDSGCPVAPPDGTRREQGALVQSRAILGGGDRLGTLTLRIEVPTAATLLRRSLPVAAAIMGGSLLIAAVLMAALEARVSAPVMAIARVAQRMAESPTSDERAPLTGGDEVGVLAGSFNLMLDEIARRDRDLDRNRRRLEAEVAERSRVNSELVRARDKAEEATRLKSEFLANMSHEIRTPMNGVLGMISLVLDRCTDPEQRDQLRTALHAAESLTAILNDILDLSRIEAGKMKIESIAFDLHGLLRDCLRTFDSRISEKRLEVRLSVAPDCPKWVRGDPVRLRQILLNLIGNAVKFTIEGGIAMEVSPAGGNLMRIQVRDTGIGIPRDKLEVIFEAFTQADGSHTRRFGGSGLGLAITRRLVSLLHGQLSAESQPGSGSRFCVELPLHSCTPPADHAEKPATPSHSLTALRVLVAEDNVINQKVVSSMLRRQGWTVTLAVDGREAFRHFEMEPFDLVLMDVQMPVMDGLEATRMIRQQEQQNKLVPTPIIALTAHASQTQHDQCIEQGMDAVITKPVTLPALLETISATLRRVSGDAAAAELIPQA